MKCENCRCRPVCDRYKATGGVNACEHHIEERKGVWLAREDTGHTMHECSLCGARVAKGFYEYKNPNLFCYRCGADMRGGQ